MTDTEAPPSSGAAGSAATALPDTAQIKAPLDRKYGTETGKNQGLSGDSAAESVDLDERVERYAAAHFRELARDYAGPLTMWPAHRVDAFNQVADFAVNLDTGQWRDKLANAEGVGYVSLYAYYR